ncbi:MAG: 3-keto-5-aminohexanoate cleavage protein [Clostridiales Family XIII bacterium]|jgi:uncharacterized protein (DUF849 family)|nr:3-keto-5-aminohexanoate cleavage protein [Clostridiales Family XIII bacterium]
MGKLIITAALCGAGTTKAQTPHVPVTPDEIAADSVACVKAGASVLHIHVRDKDGVNSMDTEIFVETVGKMRAALAAEGLDAVLNLTTSGSKFSDELRMGHLPILKPEMCSYDPGTMNWANSYVFLNTPAFLEKLGKYVQELDIKPELEIFDGGMIGNINYYIKKGVLKTPCHVQFVLGVTGGMPGDAEALSYLLPKIPKGSTWSVTGIGRSHVPCMLLGLAEGCDGLRVGLEDNIFYDKGVLATNAELVTRAAELGRLAGREIANAAEAREILGVRKKV